MTPKDSMECVLRALAELRQATPKEPQRLVEMWNGAIIDHVVIDELNRMSTPKK